MFIYWTFLGVFDALVFFFGAYFMFENTTVTSNGQVSTEPRRVGWAAWESHTGAGRGSLWGLVLGHLSTKAPRGRGAPAPAGHTLPGSPRLMALRHREPLCSFPRSGLV